MLPEQREGLIRSYMLFSAEPLPWMYSTVPTLVEEVGRGLPPRRPHPTPSNAPGTTGHGKLKGGLHERLPSAGSRCNVVKRWWDVSRGLADRRDTRIALIDLRICGAGDGI